MIARKIVTALRLVDYILRCLILYLLLSKIKSIAKILGFLNLGYIYIYIMHNTILDLKFIP